MKNIFIFIIFSLTSFELNAQHSVFELLSLGNEKLSTGDCRAAIAYFNLAIEYEPEHGYGYLRRGIAKSLLDDYRGAIADFNKSIEINSEFLKYKYEEANHLIDAVRDAYVLRGDNKRRLKDYGGAISDCNKAIEIDSKYYSAFLIRGACKLDLSDIEGACLDWSKAGELGSDKAYEAIRSYCK
jgi:tetratricopeptide (TPR) repeat protein